MRALTGVLACLCLAAALAYAGSASAATEQEAKENMAQLERALTRLGDAPPVADPRAGRPAAARGEYNVMEFGAKGDGVADDTEAFQKALNAAYYDGGGIVKAPRGNFLIKTHLIIPSNVTLEGVWRKPQRGLNEQDKNDKPNVEPAGTTLLAVEGKGDPDGTPFITLCGKATTDPIKDEKVQKANATISGITIFYPEQIKANPPHAYPWTVRGDGDDCGVLNVTMVNPYQAVDFGTKACGRHYIDGLFAYPLFKGIYVNACFDVGRINNIHFWPFWDIRGDSPLWEFTKQRGTAYIFGRTDGEMVSNCFSIFYKTSLHLIAGPIQVKAEDKEKKRPAVFEGQGGAGVFTNCYFDVSSCAVKVDETMRNAGASFSNCVFMSTVDISAKNRGPLKFVNCGFWGVGRMTQSQAKIRGYGTTIFDSCQFSGWDQNKLGVPCIDANGRQVIVQGCDFITDRWEHQKVRLGPMVRAAIVSENIMPFGALVTSEAPKEAEVVITNNVTDNGEAFLKNWVVLGPFPNTPVDPEPIQPVDKEPIVARLGYSTDYLNALGGEENAILKPGAKVQYDDKDGKKQTVEARATSANRDFRVDFGREFGKLFLAGYAYCEVEAKTEGWASFEMGSNDSPKVWINGQLVHSKFVPLGRGCAPGDDQFKAYLNKGKNRILVKVEDGAGRLWEMMLEGHDADGNILKTVFPKVKTDKKKTNMLFTRSKN